MAAICDCFNSSYGHNAYDGFNIYESYFIAYIRNKCCYGYGHNGSKLHNSFHGHIGCYGHKGLNCFKCCKGFNFSSGSSNCIASNDLNGSYDVLVLMTKMIVMAMIEWPHWLLWTY